MAFPFATPPNTGSHSGIGTPANATPILPPKLSIVQLTERERAERSGLGIPAANVVPGNPAPAASSSSSSSSHSNAQTLSVRPGNASAVNAAALTSSSTQSMESAVYGLCSSSSLPFVLESMVKNLERFTQLDGYSSVRMSTAQEINHEIVLDERMRRADVQTAMPRVLAPPKTIQKLEKLRKQYEISASVLQFVQAQAANMTQFSALPYSYSQHFMHLPTLNQKRNYFNMANLMTLSLQNKLGNECQEMIRRAMQQQNCSLTIQQLAAFRPYVQHHQVYAVAAQSAAAVAGSTQANSMLLDAAISELHVWREVHIEKDNDYFGVPNGGGTAGSSSFELYHCFWFGRPPSTHARYSSSLRPMKTFSVNDIHAFLVGFPTLQFQYEWVEEGLFFEENDGVEIRIFIVYRLQRPGELKSAEKVKTLEGKYFVTVKCIQESEKFREADQNVNDYAKELQQWVQFTKYIPTFT